eukprot:c20444_g1_i3 orf=235-447(-)
MNSIQCSKYKINEDHYLMTINQRFFHIISRNMGSDINQIGIAMIAALIIIEVPCALSISSSTPTLNAIYA